MLTKRLRRNSASIQAGLVIASLAASLAVIPTSNASSRPVQPRANSAPVVRAKQEPTAARPQAAVLGEARRQLSSGDEETRFQAVLTLSSLQLAEAAPLLQSALNDSSPKIRAAALEGLAFLRDPVVVSVAATWLKTSKDVFVRKTAMYALGELGSPAGTPILAAALRDKNVEVRGAAAVALTLFRDPAAVPALMRALDDGSGFVRAESALALGTNAGSAAAAGPRLIKLLDMDPVAAVKRQAAATLGLLGDPAALPSLERARQSQDPYLSEDAISAINKIHEKSRDQR
ncbi:MAG TPA: HEAT repeat domain-containing protein [Blastocatellia bacterium]|nr:HEAT repeat domain-containing protein [Blastocatellia bacterium]